MPDQVVLYETPAGVVRSFLAADALEAFGRRTRHDLERRAKGLAAEGRRIDASNRAKARALQEGAFAALDAHPEWRDEVKAALEAARKRSENAA